jgi:hypothetical protein
LTNAGVIGSGRAGTGQNTKPDRRKGSNDKGGILRWVVDPHIEILRIARLARSSRRKHGTTRFETVRDFLHPCRFGGSYPQAGKDFRDQRPLVR